MTLSDQSGCGVQSADHCTIYVIAVIERDPMPRAKNMAARKSKEDDFPHIEIEEGMDDSIHEAVLKASR